MNELYHHGILGMHWGRKNGPPYPLSRSVSAQVKRGNNPAAKSGSLSAYIKKKKQEKAVKRQVEARKKQLEQARNELAKKQEKERQKEKILRTGTAKEVLAIKNSLTYDEMNKALNRIKLEDALAQYVKPEKSKWDDMNDLMSKVKYVEDWTRTGVEGYNMLASIHNSTEEGQKNPWKEIKLPSTKKKKG